MDQISSASSSSSSTPLTKPPMSEGKEHDVEKIKAMFHGVRMKSVMEHVANSTTSGEYGQSKSALPVRSPKTKGGRQASETNKHKIEEVTENVEEATEKVGGLTLANASEAMGRTSPLIEFIVFSNLPAELQLKIWSFATPPPRLIDVYERTIISDDSHTPTGIEHIIFEERVGVEQPKTLIIKNRKLPGVFHACINSRTVTMKEYTVAFADRLHSPTYVDFKKDIIRFRGTSALFKFLYVASHEERWLIRNIALDVEDYQLKWLLNPGIYDVDKLIGSLAIWKWSDNFQKVFVLSNVDIPENLYWLGIRLAVEGEAQKLKVLVDNLKVSKRVQRVLSDVRPEGWTEARLWVIKPNIFTEAVAKNKKIYGLVAWFVHSS